MAVIHCEFDMFKIIFFGTSDFAVPSLEALSRDPRFQILGVVTQPDRPVGRHAKLTPPPVKNAAQRLGISTILQPEKISDVRRTTPDALLSDCDAFIVVSYGKILPQWLLNLPKMGVLNVHGSLLPRWRGASPIQSAIAAGDEKSGVTIMKLDAEMDHGPILSRAEETILATDTGGTLHDRLAILGAKILPDTLTEYLEGKIATTEQDHSHATLCKILTRDDGRLDFSKPAQELERLVRAYDPWPGTWTEIEGKRIKVLTTRVGTSVETDQEILMNCGGDTILEIRTLQPEGRSAMSASEFLRGHRRG